MGSQPTNHRMFTSLVLVLLLLFGSIGVLALGEPDKAPPQNLEYEQFAGPRLSDADVDVPVLHKGDRWTYAGVFDVAEMIANSGVETDAEALYAKAGQLSRQAPAPHAVIARMSEVVINSPGMGPKEFDDVCAMLENVAVADGEVTTIERDLIQIWRRKAGLN